jgi:serine/threonine-protein kinase
VEATGRFDLRERISGGVTAEVYRAYDREQDRDVVIRILRDGLDSEYVERFQRAAEDAADVRHANVVAVLAHGELDGRPFAARELVEGSTLDDLLARRGPLPEEEARGLAAQIATGLSAAHARGLLHRDLSAGSVIVAADGTAKVADFAMPGVSRHPAPEQIAGQLIDERTDVYGLGAVLYHMLTGHVPRGRPVSPRRLVPRVSKRVEAVAMRALEPDPARRYPTAAAMADALRSATPPIRRVAPVAVPAPAAAPVAVAARRPARPKVAPPAPRRRSSALPFALLALPLVALVVGGLLLTRTQPSRTAVLSATTTPQAVIATAAASPTAAATASPEPTSLPPVETTPEPTLEPTPEPTAAPTVAPPPAPPAAAAPTTQSTPVPPTTQSAPVATVLSFYDLVNRKRFDEAAALWSPRMQANYPPSTNIYGRFDRTRQIIVRGIAQSAESAGAATVTVDLLETLDSGVTRHWVGQWQLVWDGTRWLMDAPNLRAA